MKLPNDMKFTFVLNWLLFTAGVVFDEIVMICTAVIIFVVVGVGVNVLEAIHQPKQPKDKQHET